MPSAIDKCSINLYADDTTLYHSDSDPRTVQSALNKDLESTARWIKANGLRMNIEKTQMLTLSRKSMLHRRISINVSLDGTDIPQTDSVKYLGVTIDKDLNWKAHTEQVRCKSLAALSTIKRSSSFLPINTRKLYLTALFAPTHLDYCPVVWHSCNSTISKRIERIQNYGMRVILGKPPRTSSSPLRDQLGWTTLQERRQRFMLTLVHRCLLNLAPPYLKNNLNSTRHCTTLEPVDQVIST